MSTITDNYNHLMELSKRAIKSGYKEFLVHNRMIMACYDISTDSDQGMHYILHVPDDYADLYDKTFLLNLNDLNAKAKESKNRIDEIRNEKKLPPRAVEGELKYWSDDTTVYIDVSYTLYNMEPHPETRRKALVKGARLANLGFTLECKIVDDTHQTVANILNSYGKIIARTNGETMVMFDGLENHLLDRVKDYPRVFYCTVKLNGETIQVPFLRSFFRNISKFDRMIFGITATKLKGIALFTMTYESKGLVDQYISYIQNFK